MTTLARYSSNLVGFFSYSREDDADFDDVLSKFRVAIQATPAASPRWPRSVALIRFDPNQTSD
jgi:hypothetical protein